MNFDWVKVPKSEEEEKEQFDTLYQFLSKLSNKGKEGSPSTSIPSTSVSSPHIPITSGMDEFMRLKMDLLSNFQSMGVGITPLETCKGCERSFYSKTELDRHWEQSGACAEWVKRELLVTERSNMPFFSFIEQGLSSLLYSDQSVSYCMFCKKQVNHRKGGHEKHLQQSMICNRLAHDTFQKWMCNK
jgi:hypothetical protein